MSNFNACMDVFQNVLIFLMGMTGLGICGLWYLGTEKMLIMREQRRMIKESRKYRDSKGLATTHYKIVPGHFDGRA